MSGESFNRVLVITVKEWQIAFKNRTILLLMLLMPVLLIALPLLLLAYVGTISSSAGNGSLGLVLNNPSLVQPQLFELFQAALANQFMLLLLIVALPLPAVIAVQSVAEEKRSRSFEPLLTTPISLSELLVGKVLAAALPGILSIWLSFVVYWLLAGLLVLSDAVFNSIINLTWILAMVLVGPLLALLSACLGLLVSLRSNAPRASGQLSLLVTLPIVLLFVAQALGVPVVNPLIMLILALISGGIDFWLFRLARSFLHRETLLTVEQRPATRP
ncbi:MAG TPA: ABC transporter permease subunit [Ktedonobacterales bacterium]|jgi:ABC-2 type transport system permease protein